MARVPPHDLPCLPALATGEAMGTNKGFNVSPLVRISGLCCQFTSYALAELVRSL